MNPLAAFAGKQLKGTWTLEVGDIARGNTGTLNSWSLVATGQSLGTSALTAAGTPAPGTTPAPLTETQLQPIVREPVRRWNLTGLTAAERGLLKSVQFNVADLDGATLGLAAGNTVTLDRDAAGWGWFVDPTPRSDSEFRRKGDQGEQGGMDLLTAVVHELGHVLGREHADGGVMGGDLAAGTRLSPTPARAAPPAAAPAGGAWLLASGRRR